MYERFTDTARRAVVRSQEEARRLQHDYIGTEHLLLGVVAEATAPATRVLATVGITGDAVRLQVQRSVPAGTAVVAGHIPFSASTKKALELSLREALLLSHNYIGTEHLLLGLTREDNGAGGLALRSLGADLESLRAGVRNLGALSAPPAAPAASPAPAASAAPAATTDYRFETYTDRARRAVVSAQEEARGLNHNYIGGEHLLLGLLMTEGAAALALESLGVSYEWAHGRIMEVVGPGTETPTGHIPFTSRAKKVMELALREAATLDHRYIGVEHLLLGLMREGEGVAVQLLTGFLGEDGPRRVRARVVQLITDPPEVQQQEPSVPEPPVPAEPPVTASHDLTEAARRSRLDPVAGREREIQRLMQVLMRKSRNSALLVGEAGVGRTSIVMGLAQRLAGGEAPAGLSGVRLRAVHPGQLRTALAELRDPATTVLFLDDADLAEGSDILSALRESGFRVIAVVEPAAHRPALETFFQPVPVGEPSLEDTVAILRLLRPEYERHHAVSITDDALEAAVTLTVRHLPGRVLPGKAIEVLDEAGARVRLTDGAQTVDAAVVAELFAEAAGPPRRFDDDRYVWAMS